MRSRCNNPNRDNYRYYGGRGIRVCRRWDRFENFLADMGRRPTSKHTLERDRVNGHYMPKNCRWATQKEQARNKRSSITVRYKGNRMPLIEAAKQAGIQYYLAWRRLRIYGWSPARALTP